MWAQSASGAVLGQFDHASPSKRRIVCFVSRLLTDVERRYSQCEKKALAAVWERAVRGPFTFITYNRAINWSWVTRSVPTIADSEMQHMSQVIAMHRDRYKLPMEIAPCKRVFDELSVSVGVVSSYQRVCASRLWHWSTGRKKSATVSSVPSSRAKDRLRAVVPVTHAPLCMARGIRWFQGTHDAWLLLVRQPLRIFKVGKRWPNTNHVFWMRQTCTGTPARHIWRAAEVKNGQSPTISILLVHVFCKALGSRAPHNHAFMAQGKCWSWKFHAKIEQSGLVCGSFRRNQNQEINSHRHFWWHIGPHRTRQPKYHRQRFFILDG